MSRWGTQKHNAAVTALLGTLATPLMGQSARQAAIQRGRLATVVVVAAVGSDTALGSGFIVSPSGVVVTAAHVVDGASSVSIRTASGQAYDVTGVYVIDRSLDFALLKFPSRASPSLRLGNSDSVIAGQRVLAIGAPLGLETTITDGLVSAIRNGETRNLLQISVPVSHGSSGGPVLNEKGQVIGIVLSGVRSDLGENLNFALPINYVREALATSARTDPVSVAEAVTVTLGERQVTTSPNSVVTPSRVNDSLTIDWSSLDGVSAYSVNNNHTRTLSAAVHYLVTRDPSGVPVLERYSASVWNQGFHDLLRDEERTVLYQNRDSHEYFSRTGLEASIQSYSWESQVTHGAWEVTSQGTNLGSSQLPSGVVPLVMLHGFIAALPDSLPSSLTVWSFTWDSTVTARVVPIRFDFGRHERIKVPIAPPGDECRADTKVSWQKRDVIWVTQTAEAERSEFPVLATRPHLLVSSEDTQCIGLPIVGAKH